MFETFLGLEIPMAVRFLIAFLAVLALIGLSAWLVRRFGANRFGVTGLRGRQPRLAVIDAALIDGRRRLVLIRRDNIEHLLMLGGPTDLVIEPNIIRAPAGRDIGRAAMGAEIAGRGAPAMDNGWPLQSANEPSAFSRGQRAATPDSQGFAGEANAPLTASDMRDSAAAEIASRRIADLGSPARGETARRTGVAPAVSSAAITQANGGDRDRNLTDMALQLETSLRRKPPLDSRSSATGPAGPYANRPSDPALKAPARDFKRSLEPTSDAQAEPKFEPKQDLRPEPKIEASPPTGSKAEPEIGAPARAPLTAETAASTANQLYDNLEEEMASLLGRPTAKS